LQQFTGQAEQLCACQGTRMHASHLPLCWCAGIGNYVVKAELSHAPRMCMVLACMLK
jgi:hypothetical protein